MAECPMGALGAAARVDHLQTTVTTGPATALAVVVAVATEVTPRRGATAVMAVLAAEAALVVVRARSQAATGATEVSAVAGVQILEITITRGLVAPSLVMPTKAAAAAAPA